jgi:hypothetical protein
MAPLTSTPHTPPARRSSGPDALEAVERLALATERAASARIERAIHGAIVAGRGVFLSAVLITAAAALAALGWLTLMIGAALLLSPVLGAGVAAAAVGVTQLIVGAGIAFAAWRTAGAGDDDAQSEQALS